MPCVAYAIQSSDLGVLFECCIRKQQQLEGMDEKAASCHQGVFWSQIPIIGNNVILQ